MSNPSQNVPENEAAEWFPQTRAFLHWFLSPARHLLMVFGFGIIDLMKIAKYVFKGHIGFKKIIEQLAFVGNDSMPVALLLCGTVGAVLAMQLANELASQGGEAYVGALVSMALVRELGPIMTGFAVIAMAGSAFAAEITTMKSNSQIAALKVLHVDPIRYLMLPRVAATLIAMPLLTVLGTTLGIITGMYAANQFAAVPHQVYLDSVRGFLELKDLWVLLLKSLIFGSMISVLSCSIGFMSSNQTSQSAQSVTMAVVWSFIAMVAADFVITFIFY